MSEEIDAVLADMHEHATVLKAAGHAMQSAHLEAFAQRVAAASEDYRHWISEEDAVLRSAKSVGWLRARFAEWERQGNAKRDGRRRLYRQVIVPMRANPSAARAAGRAA